MGVFDVPATRLIQGIASDLEKKGIEKPPWSEFVKTGVSRKRVPENRGWFYVRLASVLYRVFKDGPVGTEALRTYYGGKKRQGPRKAHFRKSSGKVARTCLQVLEKQGLVKKGKKGRSITGKGHSYLSSKAKEVYAELQKEEGERKEKQKKAEEERKKRIEKARKEREKKEGEKEERKGKKQAAKEVKKKK